MAVGPVMLSREPDYHISRGPSSLDCFNVILAELGTLLTAEQGPQDLDTLARLLADEQRELASEWPAAHADPVARLDRRRLRQLDQTIALAAPKLGNDRIRHTGRRQAVEHDADHARRPARGVPLQRDQHEGVTREQSVAEPRQVGAPLPRVGGF